MVEGKVSGVVQVSNLCPLTNAQQLELFFGFIGKVKRVSLHIDAEDPQNPAMAFVEFSQPVEAALATHLSAVHWMDRPMVIQPAGSFPGEMPSMPVLQDPQAKQILECAPLYEVIVGMPIPMLPGMTGQVSVADPKAAVVKATGEGETATVALDPAAVSTAVSQEGQDRAAGNGVVDAMDTAMDNGGQGGNEQTVKNSHKDSTASEPAVDNTVPSPMPDWARIAPIKCMVLSTLEITRQDEIKRTIRINNVDSRVIPDDLLTFFKMCGPINFVRLVGDPAKETRYAFVEFTNQDACNAAVTLDGISLKGRPVSIDGNWWFNAGHSLAKQAEKEQREINEAMKRLKEVEARLNKQFQQMQGNDKESDKQKDEEHSESRSRDRERHSRRRSRQRSHSRSPRRRRSRSRGRKRSYSPRHRRGSRRSRSLSRSPSPRRRHRHSRSRSPSRSGRRARSRERDSRSRLERRTKDTAVSVAAPQLDDTDGGT